MKTLEITNLLGDKRQYDLFLLIPSVDVLPCIDQYIIYGHIPEMPYAYDLEPVRVFDEADEALAFCQECNEARRERIRQNGGNSEPGTADGGRDS